MDKQNSKHGFLFFPGKWTGEGKILLNMVEENLKFLADWSIAGKDLAGKVQCVQEIQIQGLSEGMRNEIVFFDFQPKTFSVEMENQNVGKVVGKGVFDEKNVAWEFRNNELNFEGFETYSLIKEGCYRMYAEYVSSSDQFRTQIQGEIWLKN